MWYEYIVNKKKGVYDFFWLSSHLFNCSHHFNCAFTGVTFVHVPLKAWRSPWYCSCPSFLLNLHVPLNDSRVYLSPVHC